jgi:hypothetical protein
MSKQVRIRRDSSSNLAIVTPADSELGHDTTIDELLIGDGTTAGGIPHPNFKSVLNNRYVAATAGGTGDAITIALTKAPASYTTFMRVIFKATANNTGATTVNVNSLGVKNLQKISGGALAALASGDIVSGGVYEIMYDGTQFQLLTLQNAGITSVAQGDLNTSTGTISGTPNTNISSSGLKYSSTHLTLPGGQYGFSIETRLSSGNDTGSQGFWYSNTSGTFAQKVAAFSLTTDSPTVAGQQRYISSSPPFDLGDGEAGGFLFLLMNGSGETLGHYAADVPPWAYNGPTDIRCTHKSTITGKKFRTAMKKRSLEEIMDGASIQYQLEEITQDIKNADMGLIPHPFGDVQSGEKVVLIDPMDDRIQKMIEYQNAGGGDEIVKAILKGQIYADSEQMNRKGPEGVMQSRLKFKYSG